MSCIVVLALAMLTTSCGATPSRNRRSRDQILQVAKHDARELNQTAVEFQTFLMRGTQPPIIVESVARRLDRHPILLTSPSLIQPTEQSDQVQQTMANQYASLQEIVTVFNKALDCPDSEPHQEEVRHHLSRTVSRASLLEDSVVNVMELTRQDISPMSTEERDDLLERFRLNDRGMRCSDRRRYRLYYVLARDVGRISLQMVDQYTQLLGVHV